MIQKRFIFSGVVIWILVLAVATMFGALSLLGIRWVAGEDVSHYLQPITDAASPADSESEFSPTATLDIQKLDSEIDALESAIQIRQLKIEREQVVKMLNENRINDYERKIYFDLLNSQANARTRQIELRLKRLRTLVDQGSES